MPLPEDLRRANDVFAAQFAEGGLERPPRRRLAILTCMDARIDPVRLFGLEVGDAHVLRNAGARATDDVVRSLVVAQRLLSVEQVLVLGHTDCGLEGVSNDELRDRVGADAAEIDFAPFADVDAGVRETVSQLRADARLAGAAVAGAVYDVRTGRVYEP